MKLNKSAELFLELMGQGYDPQMHTISNDESVEDVRFEIEGPDGPVKVKFTISNDAIDSVRYYPGKTNSIYFKTSKLNVGFSCYYCYKADNTDVVDAIYVKRLPYVENFIYQLIIKVNNEA